MKLLRGIGARNFDALRALVGVTLLLGVFVATAESEIDTRASAARNAVDAIIDTGGNPSATAGSRRPVALAVAAERDVLCWAEYDADRIVCTDLDGRSLREAARVDGPQGVALDAAAQRLYWTADAAYPRRVGWSPLPPPAGKGAPAAQSLWAGVEVNRPRAIAFDGMRESLLWSEAVSGRLRRARIGTATPQDLLVSGFGVADRADSAEMHVLGLALLSADELVWSDMARETIERAAADGSQRRVLFAAADGIGVPAGMAVDVAQGVVYWADAARGEILRAVPGAGAPTVVVGATHGLIEPRGIAFDPVNAKIYWSDATRDVIGRVAVAGGRVEELRLAAPAAGFEAVESRPVPPAQCDAAAVQQADLRARKAVLVCLEKVDAHHAVKVQPDDVRSAARICVDQLHRLARERGSWAPCLSDASRREVWRQVGARVRRAAWWLEEVRPFIEAMAEVPADALAAREALAVLDEIAAALSRDVAAPRTGSARPGLPASGQRSAYGADRADEIDAPVPVADDGSQRAGAPLRFVDNRDGTITDANTGLMWEKKCDGCSGLHEFRRQMRWSSAHDETVWDWIDALNAEGGGGFAGYRDWRLANVKELQSLVDYERFNPAVATALDGARCGLGCTDLTDPACSCTETSEYWTATTTAADASRALYVGFHLGLIGDIEKSDDLPARAVRGGRARAASCHDSVDGDGASPLLHALLAGDSESAVALLDAGADARCRMRIRANVLRAVGADMPEETQFVEVFPILAAAFAGNDELVRLLIAHGADVDAAADDGSRALHLAAQGGHDRALKTLLDAGADAARTSATGETALMLAVKQGRNRAVEILLAAGAAPDQADADGVTPLIAAIEHGEVEIVARLLRAGARADSGVSEHGLSAIMLAAATADREIVAALLDHGADAAMVQKVSSDALAELGVEIESGLQLDVTPLLLAAQNGSAEVAEVLLKHGADLNFVNPGGINALLVAVFTGNAEFVEWLLDHGAVADYRTPRGDTALITAIEQANVDVARALLEAGASANLADDRGVSPLRVATEQGNAELIALLRRFGAEPESAEDYTLAAVTIDTRGFDPWATRPIDTRLEPLAVTVDARAGWVYWAEYRGNRIRRARLDGTGIEVVLDHRAEGPIGLALEPDGEILYWTSDSSYPRRVRALDVADLTWETLAQGPPVNRPRAIVATAAGVYWTEAVNGRLRFAAGPGSAVIEIFDDGISSFGDRPDYRPFYSLGLAAAPRGAMLFWSEVASSEIESAQADGSERRVLFSAADGVDFPAGVAFDEEQGDLYWVDVARAVVLRAPIAGGSPEVVVDASDGLIEPRAVAVESRARKLYWTDASLDAIGRSNLDGTEVEVLRLGSAEGRGFSPPPRPPTGCSAAVMHAAEQFQRSAVKRLSLCLEKVDVLKAVKRGDADARGAVATCVGQLAALHPDESSSLDGRLRTIAGGACGAADVAAAAILRGCGVADSGCSDSGCAVAACTRRVWAIVAQRQLRSAEWIEEVRPFVAAVASLPGAAPGATARALTVLDAAYAGVQAKSVGGETSAAAPRTGMTTSYRAVRKGGAEGVAVADDGALRIGAPLRFVDNRNGTITDTHTGLMWRRSVTAAAVCTTAETRMCGTAMARPRRFGIGWMPSTRRATRASPVIPTGAFRTSRSCRASSTTSASTPR